MFMIKIGQNSLEVCKEIVRNHTEISEIYLIAHAVLLNWRQINNTAEKQIENLLQGLVIDNPLKKQIYSRKDFLGLRIQDLERLGDNIVWSMTSKVKCLDGSIKHIPMMNFHPESNLTVPKIIEIIKRITNNKKGFFLETGRYYHYYGNFLLTEKEWLRFLSRFLATCVLISPRYIAHRLYDGYCTLRLTTDAEFKPKIPKIIKLV